MLHGVGDHEVHRRYQIFISSTSDDLKCVRETLIRETIACGHFPVAMEDFTAVAVPDKIFLRNEISRADVFVILIGARHGSSMRRSRTTFVQFEYETAVELGKPILAFLLDESEYRAARLQFPEGHSERQHDVKLRNLRNAVRHYGDRDGRIVKFFSLQMEKQAELVHSYQLALQNEIQSLRGRGGWIRGVLFDELSTSLRVDPQASQNAFLKKILTSLEKFTVLHKRCSTDIDLKTAIAHYFLDLYLGQIVKAQNWLFFDSGSTIACLFDELLRLRDTEAWVADYARLSRFETNNILVYLRATFLSIGRVDLYPYGPPEEKYGATFGPLNQLPVARPTAPYDRKPPVAKEITDHFSLAPGRGVLMMTSSGFELAPGKEGPHVGSYYNALFKRALLESGTPAVLLLDQVRFERRFKPSGCYHICDQKFTWAKLCAEQPLALAAAFRDPKMADQVVSWARKRGLKHTERELQTSGITTVVMANYLFNKALDNSSPAPRVPEHGQPFA